MLPETVAALAAGDRVSVASLFQFNFQSQTQRYWDGIGSLVAGGFEWMGSGKLISAAGLEQSINLSAPQATFTLTGATDEMMAYAAASEFEVTGRPCSVYIQFLSAPGVPLDDPIAIWAGVMDVMSFEAGVKNQTISLTAETLFVGRNRSSYGYMTSTDQEARWPGDLGMEFMAVLMNRTVNWLRG